jgi:hypothetical protein
MQAILFGFHNASSQRIAAVFPGVLASAVQGQKATRPQ